MFIEKNILLLFNEPNNSSPYNGEASKVWVECEKKFKSLARTDLSVKDSDKLYMECFEPFINESKRIMYTNDLSAYAKWFPELNPHDTNYKEKIEMDKTEVANLELSFNQLKLSSKKTTSVPHVESNSDTEPPKQKKSRWEKYQST